LNLTKSEVGDSQCTDRRHKHTLYIRRKAKTGKHFAMNM